MPRLEWEQVLERVRRGEDERTEFKRWEAFPDKVAAAFVLTEEQIVPGTSPSDVDLAVFHDFLERQGFDPDEDPRVDWVRDLANRGVVRIEGDEPRVTLYGLLCFGRQPQMFPPTRSSWLEMVAYQGTDRASDVLLHGE
ncbi:MAG: hypothetical protein GY856_33630, partial [bacterium]|nr:hypothetical protein [bacterium]